MSIANEQATTVSSNRPRFSWWRLLLGIAVTVATLWFIRGQVELADVGTALRSAEILPILAGTLIILLTGLTKAWRWQWLFVPASERPSFPAAFWALQLNQFVNTVIFGRFGELARAYDIDKTSNVGKARALGTIVVEKSLDMLFTVLTVLLLVPWIVLPDNISDPTLTLTVTTIAIFVILYVLAFQTDWMVAVVERLAQFLPTALGQRVIRITTSGIQGVHALRDRRHTLSQLGISTIVAILYILTPYALFATFDLPFTFVDATLLHLWVSIANVVTTTPGRIGVFEGVVLALLTQLAPDSDPSILLSFAIVYHLVVMVPPLLLGGWAAIRSDWRVLSRSEGGWQTSS